MLEGFKRESLTSFRREMWADLVMKLPMKERDRPPRPMLNVLIIWTRLVAKRMASEWVLLVPRLSGFGWVKGSALECVK